MPATPLVSIVTPSYNQAAFLEQTLRSVLEQDYPAIEYLVVDGASSDGSVAIIERYAHRLAWWVSERDGGQAEAINKGLARCRGEIVAWLNSDDLYLPGTVTAAVAALQANPQAGMVFANMLAIDGAGETINVLRYGDWGLAELMQFQIIGQPAVFMRRAALEQAGLLDLNFHLLLDHHLWLRMAQVAPIRYVDQTWSAARYHAGAKNIAQARAFGQEAYAIVDWMPRQPRLERLFHDLQRRIWAGAHRMNARYLLDGGLPGPALKAYLRSLWAYPPIALQERNRMLFAAASLVVNVDALRERYLRRRRARIQREQRPG